MDADAEYWKFDRILWTQATERMERSIRAGKVMLRPAMIQLARESRGLARWQLARRLGVKASDVADWEDGVSAPSVPADALAATLGYTLTFFVQEDEIVPLHFCGHDPAEMPEPRKPDRPKAPPTQEEIDRITTAFCRAHPV